MHELWEDIAFGLLLPWILLAKVFIALDDLLDRFAHWLVWRGLL